MKNFEAVWKEIKGKAREYQQNGKPIKTLIQGTQNKIIEIKNDFIRRDSEDKSSGSTSKITKNDCLKIWNQLVENGFAIADKSNTPYFVFSLINLLDEIYFTKPPLVLYIKQKKRFYVIGSRYGGSKTHEGYFNVFSQMIAKNAVSVGFLGNKDLSGLVGQSNKIITDFVDQFKDSESGWKQARQTLSKFLNLKSGDIIAIKSHGRNNHLTIIGYAIVEERNGSIYEFDSKDHPGGLGHLIHVKFLETGLHNDTGYTLMHTFHEVIPSNPYFKKIFGTWSDIELNYEKIFDGEYEEDINEEDIIDKNTSTYTRKTPGEQIVTQIHNIIQNRLHHILKSKFPKDKIKKEFQRMIDLRRENEKEIFYYEVKPFNESYNCISASIKQLLEYSYLFPTNKKLNLVIAGKPKLDDKGLKFLNYLKSISPKLNLKYFAVEN